MVKLPPDFIKDTESPGIGAEDFLIDEMGFTGKIFASNILSLEKGNIAGWKFSIDTIDLAFKEGNIDRFEFNGQVVVPVNQEGELLDYGAYIDTDFNYHFLVSNTNKMNLDLWAAEATIDPSSFIAIEKVNGEFMAKAVLNGKMDISIPGEQPINLAEIEFQELTVQTIEPKFDVKTFSANVGNVSGFPIQINDIQYKRNGLKAGIDMSITVNLVSAEDNGFGAEGKISILGEEVENEGITSWKYSGTIIKSLSIDIEQSAFSFKGLLTFYDNDEVYGKGVKGMIDASFSPGISVKSMVQFGAVNDYRYWYADAYAILSKPQKITPSASLYGFGGGAYYHMQQNMPQEFTVSNNAEIRTDSSSAPGTSLSGITYTPNSAVSLGIKAGVSICSSGNEKAFNGNVMLGVEFLEDGGLNNISLVGDVLLMTEPGTDKQKAKFYAGLTMLYDVKNKSLTGDLEMYMNISQALRGSGQNGRAGVGQVFFSPDDWYIYLGKPDNRIGITIMERAEINAYFVAGTIVPGMPSLPENIKNNIENIELIDNRRIDQLEAGSGFAFGASFNLETGREDVLIFYGEFDATLGFDLMLADYGENISCQGQEEGLGINGWYGQGQLYAYFQGIIGMRIKLFSVDKNIDILNINSTFLLQAQIPNPSYMYGEINGNYNVLGGLVKGNCHFDVELGQECILPETSTMDGFDIISELAPINGSEEVGVFTSPQVAFNMEIDKTFDLVDDNGNTKSFRIKMDHLKLSSNGKYIDGLMEYLVERIYILYQFLIYQEFQMKSVYLHCRIQIHF